MSCCRIDDFNKIMVSVICTTYNHAEFIVQALEGFLLQKTSFKFEVIVHDDASTDGTQEIISEYARTYPGFIIPVLQSENLYSKGVSNVPFTYGIARGKYIALCEGDDWWVDSSKLEKQVRYMEAHPECTFCFGNAIKYSERKKVEIGKMLPANETDFRVLYETKSIGVPEAIQLSFIPTATFLFRREDRDNLPKMSEKAFAGDRFYQIAYTALGEAHYIDEVLSIYRVDNPRSMVGQWKSDARMMAQSIERFIQMDKELDAWTNCKYHDCFARDILAREYSLYALLGDYVALRDYSFEEYAKSQGIATYAKHIIRTRMPRLFSLLRGIFR